MEPIKRCPYCAEEILAAAIKCKYCQSVLVTPAARQADVSPHREYGAALGGDAVAPTPQDAIRRPFKIILRLIVAIIGAAWLFSLIHPNDQSEPGVTAATEPAAPSGASQGNVRSIYSTTAVELFRSYQANEVATDQKIGSARVEITGTVKAIDKDMFDEPEIRLDVGNEFDSVTLTLDKSQLSIASGLFKGQSVRAQCNKVTRIIDSPVGEHCQIISNNNQSSVGSQSWSLEPAVHVSRLPQEPLHSVLFGDENTLATTSAEPAASGEQSSGTQTTGVRPSFDCTKAKSPVDHLICNDEELSMLDREYEAVYVQARSAAPDEMEFIRRGRDEWLRRERECTEKSCLIEWYATRKRELYALIDAASSIPLATNQGEKR
jgi:hypothetical protein